MKKYPTIQTDRWEAALQLIAESIPYYAAKSGEPYTYRIVSDLFSEVDELIPILLARLKRRWQEQAKMEAEQLELLPKTAKN